MSDEDEANAEALHQAAHEPAPQAVDPRDATRQAIRGDVNMKPLNGEKTHPPLSKHAIGVLSDLARGRINGYRINPGVRHRLRCEGLADQDVVTGLWSITAAGRAVLADIRKARGEMP